MGLKSDEINNRYNSTAYLVCSAVVLRNLNKTHLTENKVIGFDCCT